jgi:threonyl-tRNA synthetase
MAEQIRITFPDGKTITVPKGIKGEALLSHVPQSLQKKALAIKVNVQIYELNRPIEEDAVIRFLTWEDPEGKMTFWHSSAHILAEALEATYPGIKLAIGPPIENGFYYDIDFGDDAFGPEAFETIEKTFLQLAQSGETFVRKKVSKEEAIAFYQQRNNPYKLEIIKELPDDEITFYYSGNFVDLCKGPHIHDSRIIKAVKILGTAGAYWRGDERNPQLTRVYAISFPSQEELQAYLQKLEEAKQRDHRVLGRQLDLFSFHEYGPGFPFWHPNGMVVLNLLKTFLREKLLSSGYDEIQTPILLNDTLWHLSGHYENYKENMYFTEIDNTHFAVKPMNCPGSTIVYRSQQRSYRDLPLRLFEFGLVHRHERSGVLHGLFRVRAFTQDDAHIYCTPIQIEAEIQKLLQLIFEIYSLFRFENIHVYLSTRPEKYIGSLEIWNQAEGALKQALEHSQIPYQINEGEGAFYGPKIDFVVEDSLNRKWQLGTIQLDFSMPARFGLEYIDSDGTKKTPVMIHRAILGSFERFMGILIEHTAGNFPFWLAPTQITILPISEEFIPYANEIKHQLETEKFRVKVDERNERIGRKIRDAETLKIPVLFIVGKKERETNTVALRLHKVGDQGPFALSDLLPFLHHLNHQKSFDLKEEFQIFAKKGE